MEGRISMDMLSTLTRDPSRGPVTSETEGGWDVWLLAAVFVLVAFGLVMLYSSSAVMASQRMGEHFVLLKSQGTRVIMGAVVMFVALRLDYRWYQRLIYPILI